MPIESSHQLPELPLTLAILQRLLHPITHTRNPRHPSGLRAVTFQDTRIHQSAPPHNLPGQPKDTGAPEQLQDRHRGVHLPEDPVAHLHRHERVDAVLGHRFGGADVLGGDHEQHCDLGNCDVGNLPRGLVERGRSAEDHARGSGSAVGGRRDVSGGGRVVHGHAAEVGEERVGKCWASAVWFPSTETRDGLGG